MSAIIIGNCSVTLYLAYRHGLVGLRDRSVPVPARAVFAQQVSKNFRNTCAMLRVLST